MSLALDYLILINNWLINLIFTVQLLLPKWMKNLTFCKSFDCKILYTIEIFYELHRWIPRCLVVWQILLLLLLLCCRLVFGISPWLFVIFTYHGTIKNQFIHTLSYKLYLYMPGSIVILPIQSIYVNIAFL